MSPRNSWANWRCFSVVKVQPRCGAAWNMDGGWVAHIDGNLLRRPRSFLSSLPFSGLWNISCRRRLFSAKDNDSGYLF